MGEGDYSLSFSVDDADYILGSIFLEMAKEVACKMVKCHDSCDRMPRQDWGRREERKRNLKILVALWSVFGARVIEMEMARQVRRDVWR